MKRNTFELPRPTLIREARSKNLNPTKAHMGKTRTSKPNREPDHKFIAHICKPSIGSCKICKDYINRNSVSPTKARVLILTNQFNVYFEIGSGKRFLGYSTKKGKFVIKKWRKTNAF